MKFLKSQLLVLSILFSMSNTLTGQTLDSLSQSYTNGDLSVYLKISDNNGFHLAGINYQKINDTLTIDVCIVNHVTSNFHTEDVTLQIPMFLKPNHYIVALHNGINCTNLISSEYYPPNITTGIVQNTLTSNRINVYPNPAKGFINLKVNNTLNISAITLVDITGRVVKVYNPLEKRLNTEGLSTGQYILKIETKESIFTKKIQLE